MSDYALETKVPFEFLVRWNETGNLIGSYIRFKQVVLKDGVIISSETLPPESTSRGEEQGFPLTEVLERIQLDALVRISQFESSVPEPSEPDPTPNLVISRWKGRAYLAMQPTVTTGILAEIQGDTLLDQIDAYVAANFDAPSRERYNGTATWERQDPMIFQMQTLLGLTDDEIDDWFITANAIV